MIANKIVDQTEFEPVREIAPAGSPSASFK
jgi:hypothetical protein